MDWLPEENKLTVLYGSDAHMMCVLLVEPGYPATSSSIKLHSTSGVPVSVSHSALTVSQF